MRPPVPRTGSIGLHLHLFRHHSVTPPPGLSDAELEQDGGWFWPVQALKDATFGLALVGVLFALAIGLGAPLDAPADPSSSYEARPEWYFLFLFQLLKYFEGPLVLFGTVVLPTLAGAFLVLLPFLDSGPDRRLSARKLWVGLFFGGVACVVLLTAAAAIQDGSDEGFRTKRASALLEAEEASRMAADEEWGIDASGGVVLFRGKRIFRRERCDQCRRWTATGRATP